MTSLFISLTLCRYEALIPEIFILLTNMNLVQEGLQLKRKIKFIFLTICASHDHNPSMLYRMLLICAERVQCFE